MGMHYEWDNHKANIETINPDDADYPSDEEMADDPRPALIIGGAGGGAMVIQGTKAELIGFARRLLADVESMDEWTKLEYSLDQSTRTASAAVWDCVTLIRSAIEESHPAHDYPTVRAFLHEKYERDLASVRSAGEVKAEVLDAILDDWQDTAHEYGLFTSTDGQMYWVTNYPRD